MQKVTELQFSPGCCKICGRADSRAYVDMEYMEDFHGRVYYCYECVRQLANLLDFVTPEQLASVREGYEDEIDDWKATVKHGNTVEYLAAHHISLDSFIAWLEYEEIPRGAATVARHDADSGQDESGPESGLVEPSDEQGSDRLSITF